MKEKVAVSKRLSENIAQMEEFFHECDDIKKKELMLGRQMDVACYLTFIEVSVDMGTSALSEVLKYLKGLGKEEIYQALEQNALGISDATYFDTIEDAVDGLLTGEVILFVDGFDRAVKIPDDGYPNMGITEADSEKVIRGATYFIKNGDKLEGILCINHDTSELVDVMTKLISLENLGNFVNILGIDAAFAEVEEAEIINKEKLENSIEDILCEYLDFTLLHSDKPLSLRQRENAVQVLFDKGIFNIKGAIPMVAKYLKISEPSVYRYLKAIKEKV